jgi:AsmA-like C-terminal region
MQPEYFSSYDYQKPKQNKADKAVVWSVPASVRRWLFYFAGGISAVLLFLLLLGYLFSGTIGKRALAVIKDELKTECTAGKVELSFFRSFPMAAVILHDVYIQDAFGKKLLTANEVDLDFDMMSIFSDHIVLSQITLRDAALRLHTNAKGQQNWEITKSANGAAKPFTLDLRDVKLLNVELAVLDDQIPFKLLTTVYDARLKGRFGAERFALASKAHVMVHHFDYKSHKYLYQSDLTYNTSMMVDLVKHAWSIKKGSIEIGENNEFEVSGLAIFAKQHTDCDLVLSSRRGDISFLLQLLPEKQKNTLAGLSSKGNYHAKGTIKGRLSTKSYPAVNLQFGMKNATIAHNRLGAPLQSVHFDGKLQLKPNGDGILSLPDFRASYAGAPVSMSLVVTDFRHPFIDLKAKGRLALQPSNTSTISNELVLQKGQFDLQSLELKGALHDMQNVQGRERVNISAQAQVTGLEAMYQSQLIKIPSAQVGIHAGQATIKQMTAYVANSDFEVGAEVKGILPFLLGNGQQKGVHVNAHIKSKYCDLEAVLALFAQKSSGSGANPAKATATDNSFEKIPDAQIQIQMANVDYKKVKAQDVKGKVQINDRKLGFSANLLAMQGKISLAGAALLQPNIRMDINAGLKNVDLATLFAQTDGFGQDVIKQENISGSMTGRIAAQAFFDKNGNLLTDQLVVYSDLLAHKGQLKNVQAFDDFSRVLHIDDLRNLQFTTLQNYIEVRNSMVYLPAMYIRNNACNMTISGQHGFNDQVSYNFKINAGQALFNRIKKANSDGEILAANDGGLNLYYSMTGTMANYKIIRSRGSVKKAIEDSNSRKRSISKAIDAAFARYPIDTDMSAPPQVMPDTEVIAAHEGAPLDQETNSLQQPKPSSQEKPKRIWAQSNLFSDKKKISESKDDEFLDEIVGGNE